MRTYWLKIIAGMLGIFVVGFGVISLVRQGVHTGRQVVETAEPISIPLAFIPFNLDGIRVGSVRRLTILRDQPKSVTGFRIRVEVADPEAYRALTSGCVLSVDNPTQLNNRTTFHCLPADSSMVEFGRVEVRAESGEASVNVPLYLPPHVVAEFRGSGADSQEVTSALVNADSIAHAMRKMADSLRQETRVFADSIRRTRVTPFPTP